MSRLRIRVLELGVPPLVIAVAVMAFAVNFSTNTTEAATEGASMSLAVEAADTVICPPGKAPKGADPMFCVQNGATFTLQIVGDAVPIANGYVLAQSWIHYGDELGNQFANGAVKAHAAVWPDCGGAKYLTSNTDQGGDPRLDSFNMGCVTGLLPPWPLSMYKGVLYTVDLTCDSDNNHIITQIPAGVAPAGTSGAQYTDSNPNAIIPSVTGAEVNCVPGSPPPTTPPPPTPSGYPRMSKSPALSNVFLTRQGVKIPPDTCLSGSDVANLSEGLSHGIAAPDPKDPGAVQQLAGFEFELHYDNKKVCVGLAEGQAWVDAGAICITEDAAAMPQLEGIARIGCVTVGKGNDMDALAALATIDVYPQPEIYSQAKPNQDNGVVVQLNNVNCDLSDEQGHAIPIFSCDDADVTFRYLEGDVEPDCVIDAVDAQAVAFRWGVEKGSLIYRDFMNVEPSGQQQDNDIDINDLQFVVGRFGSTCDNPHPAQEPVNPKA